MTVIAWSNGQFVDPNSAVVSPLAYGLTIGEGLFETLAVYSGKVFALEEHLDRLVASCVALGLRAPDRDILFDACNAVSQRIREFPVARMRLTVTTGPANLGVLGAADLDISVLAGPAHAPRLGEVNTQLATIATSPWRRNEFSAITGHKVTSYLENALALRAAVADGHSEALFLNTRGDVCEGATSNVVYDLGGRLITPAISSGCLPGITRALALKWAAQQGIVIFESGPGELTSESVRGAAVALLGTLRNLQLVSRADGVHLPPSGPLQSLQEIVSNNIFDQVLAS